ncbi:helix-turn-helix transcriptional regulator [Roseinatronobacter bogoriensis]|uniref:helix-turn-helix transcriptional regulator n=1 Tax=Roseinatronobacter bogoriensis TaxID=119542 RepID=UPI0008F880C2|nr:MULTISPECIES: LuxR C-terminal-related transcriptional regulator [Rhodobaca]MBB4207411.1 DNA-binding CsgD family transcriptional regulator [Rhodobaca bogoriensis DSM 18756]TDW40283.1 regulatory LuxR family protein [Rhodobaca barguzinensis]TDY70566.1 regulatory LuxR family protein [Rhodobaca bogoriensis DSM 18756]
MKYRKITWLLVLIQVVGALLFIGDIALSVTRVERQPVDWRLREAMEIGAALALMIGLLMTGVLLMQAQRVLGKAEAQMHRASSAFMEIVEESFGTWSLTPAERDVALLVLKGFSTQEIAGFRNTSEGTVKAQTNAIYRKAGVTGRGQLMSIFIDDLMHEPDEHKSEPQQ